jgi:hypothetical protein
MHMVVILIMRSLRESRELTVMREGKRGIRGLHELLGPILHCTNKRC